MVIENIEYVLQGLIAISAIFAAIMGAVVIEGFFRNKLKELFSDVHYFVFFFLVSGYFLYALGEVSFYLVKVVFEDKSPVGIQDLYWSGGAFLILVSFIALAIMLIKESSDGGKLMTWVMGGGGIVVLVLVLLFIIGFQGEFFGYFYPVISSLIVAASLSVLIFSEHLGEFGKVLMLFFLASSGILVADIFFYYGVTQGTYGMVRIISDLFYLAGYNLSWIAFITMRLKMHSLAFQK